MRARRNRRVVRPATTTKAPGRSTWNMLVWNHTKLWAATLVGVVVAVALPSRWWVISRVLTGWNAAMFILVPLTYLRMRRLDRLNFTIDERSTDAVGGSEDRVALWHRPRLRPSKP